MTSLNDTLLPDSYLITGFKRSTKQGHLKTFITSQSAGESITSQYQNEEENVDEAHLNTT